MGPKHTLTLRRAFKEIERFDATAPATTRSIPHPHLALRRVSY